MGTAPVVLGMVGVDGTYAARAAVPSKPQCASDTTHRRRAAARSRAAPLVNAGLRSAKYTPDTPSTSGDDAK